MIKLNLLPLYVLERHLVRRTAMLAGAIILVQLAATGLAFMQLASVTAREQARQAQPGADPALRLPPIAGWGDRRGLALQPMGQLHLERAPGPQGANSAGEQTPQGLEAVVGDQAGAHQFPQRLLQPSESPAEGALEVRREAGALLFQESQHLPAGG